MLLDNSKGQLKIIGDLYTNEKLLRDRSTRLFLVLFVISIVNLILDIFGQKVDELIFILSIGIMLCSIFMVIFENKARYYKNLGDKGRRAFFFKSVSKDLIVDEVFTELSIISNDIKSERSDYDQYYTHNVVDKMAQKNLELYESVYYEYYKRVDYKKSLIKKNSPYWAVFIILVFLVLRFGSQDIRSLFVSLLAIMILSPFTLDSVFLITEWDKYTNKLLNIKTQVEKIKSQSNLFYLFMEYNTILSSVPSIPNSYYNKIKNKIEGEYNKNKDKIENKIVSNWSN